MHNLDGALTSLAIELNALDGQGKSVQVEMGRKLLAARDLLRARNGERHSGSLGADGKRPPNGWNKWVLANLTISPGRAARCIQFAVDPAGMLDRSARWQATNRNTSVFLKRQIRRIWPLLTEAERNDTIDLMVSLSDGGAPA